MGNLIIVYIFLLLPPIHNFIIKKNKYLNLLIARNKLYRQFLIKILLAMIFCKSGYYSVALTVSYLQVTPCKSTQNQSNMFTVKDKIVHRDIHTVIHAQAHSKNSRTVLDTVVKTRVKQNIHCKR